METSSSVSASLNRITAVHESCFCDDVALKSRVNIHDICDEEAPFSAVKDTLHFRKENVTFGLSIRTKSSFEDPLSSEGDIPEEEQLCNMAGTSTLHQSYCQRRSSKRKRGSWLKEEPHSAIELSSIPVIELLPRLPKAEKEVKQLLRIPSLDELHFTLTSPCCFERNLDNIIDTDRDGLSVLNNCCGLQTEETEQDQCDREEIEALEYMIDVVSSMLVENQRERTGGSKEENQFRVDRQR